MARPNALSWDVDFPKCWYIRQRIAGLGYKLIAAVVLLLHLVTADYFPYNKAIYKLQMEKRDS